MPAVSVALTQALASARTKSCPCSAKGACLMVIASQGALPLDKALRIAKQIAEALESDPRDGVEMNTRAGLG